MIVLTIEELKLDWGGGRHCPDKGLYIEEEDAGVKEVTHRYCEVISGGKRLQPSSKKVNFYFNGTGQGFSIYAEQVDLNGN